MLSSPKNKKKPLICITGSPGVGKSTLAKFLTKRLGFDRLDLHHYYKRISSGYNRSKQSYDIDYKTLKEKRTNHLNSWCTMFALQALIMYKQFLENRLKLNMRLFV